MLLAAWPYPRLPDFNTEDIADAHDLPHRRHHLFGHSFAGSAKLHRADVKVVHAVFVQAHISKVMQAVAVRQIRTELCTGESASASE